MIKNDRQYRISKHHAQGLEHTLANLKERVPVKRSNTRVLKAQIDALHGELELLRSQLREYEALSSGAKPELEWRSLSDLPRLLIQARIAAGLTQADLAARLGLKEQQVQRYEGNEYAGASIRRLVEVSAALELSLPSGLHLSVSGGISRRVKEQLRRLGLDSAFIKSRFAPPGLLDREPGVRVPESAWTRMADYASRIFGVPLDAVLGDKPLVFDPVPLASARFKLPARFRQSHAAAYSLYAYFLAEAVSRAVSVAPRSLPTDPGEVRRAIKREGGLDFESALRYVWSLGIAVLPLADHGAFHGAFWRIDGRNVIVLKQRTRSRARWLFDLIHEFEHASQAPQETDRVVIEPGDFVASYRSDPAEQAASAFAGDVLLGPNAEALAEECVEAAAHDVSRLKRAVPRIAKRHDIEVGVLANYLAYRLSLQGLNWWGTASNLQFEDDDPLAVARDVLLTHLDATRLDSEQQDLLTRALQ